MDGRALGRAHRRLRVKARLRQVDLSAKCGVARWKIAKLEAGDIATMQVRDLDHCFAALGADLRLTASYRGAAIDRLFDEGHALLVGTVVERLKHTGWLAEVEVSFSDYGDRGSIDVFGWHAASRSLAVFEIKSEMGGVDPTLRPLDVKARLAPKIAQRFGWSNPGPVARILVLPEDRTARRDVARHANIFDTALPARAREISRWLRAPAGPLAGVWFLTYVGGTDAKRNPSARQRVRVAQARSRLPAERSKEAEAAA
jgi:hypothetical protein